jgi:hypothetical protein
MTIESHFSIKTNLKKEFGKKEFGKKKNLETKRIWKQKITWKTKKLLASRNKKMSSVKAA